jgi:hypothetical protein
MANLKTGGLRDLLERLARATEPVPAPGPETEPAALLEGHPPSWSPDV